MTPQLVWFCDLTTVLLCVVCKIPQILLIYRSKNVQSINETSVMLELLTYLISLTYNHVRAYPLSSYLEDPFLSFQTLVVLLLVYKYSGNLRDGKRLGGLVGMFGAMGFLCFWEYGGLVVQGLLVREKESLICSD